MSAELVEMRTALAKLRDSVESLRQSEGSSPYVRLLMNDLARFHMDLEDFSGPLLASASAGRGATTEGVGAQDVVAVLEAPYDHAPWQDADDEGIGGHRR